MTNKLTNEYLANYFTTLFQTHNNFYDFNNVFKELVYPETYAKSIAVFRACTNDLDNTNGICRVYVTLTDGTTYFDSSQSDTDITSEKSNLYINALNKTIYENLNTRPEIMSCKIDDKYINYRRRFNSVLRIMIFSISFRIGTIEDCLGSILYTMQV